MKKHSLPLGVLQHTLMEGLFLSRDMSIVALVNQSPIRRPDNHNMALRGSVHMPGYNMPVMACPHSSHDPTIHTNP